MDPTGLWNVSLFTSLKLDVGFEDTKIRAGPHLGRVQEQDAQQQPAPSQEEEKWQRLGETPAIWDAIFSATWTPMKLLLHLVEIVFARKVVSGPKVAPAPEP